MISRLEIENTALSNYAYAEELNIPRAYDFKPGKNIIIGPNGCGKSTLLNMLCDYTLCRTTDHSRVTSENIDALKTPFFKECTGIHVYNDYSKPVYHLVYSEEQREETNLRSIRQFSNMFNEKRLSSCETTANALTSLFHTMFEEQPEFSLDKIDYKNFIKKMFSKHHIDSDVFTVIMDEPDRRLDITLIDEVLAVLSNPKENEQLIASIHNPLLIYKLSKMSNINFIELAPGYKRAVVNAVDSMISGRVSRPLKR